MQAVIGQYVSALRKEGGCCVSVLLFGEEKTREIVSKGPSLRKCTNMLRTVPKS